MDDRPKCKSQYYKDLRNETYIYTGPWIRHSKVFLDTVPKAQLTTDGYKKIKVNTFLSKFTSCIPQILSSKYCNQKQG